MVTLTPLSEVGRSAPVKSAVVQMRVVLARLTPLIIAQEPDSMPGWKLAPLRTELMAGAPVANFTTKASPYVNGSDPPQPGKSPDHVCPTRIALPVESTAAASAPSSFEPPK